MERKKTSAHRGVAMNPVDHPHGGGEGKLQEGEAQYHHGDSRQKVLKLEDLKEVIN